MLGEDRIRMETRPADGTPYSKLAAAENRLFTEAVSTHEGQREPTGYFALLLVLDLFDLLRVENESASAVSAGHQILGFGVNVQIVHRRGGQRLAE